MTEGQKTNPVMFWGCMIQNRIPFVEKAIRSVFKKLDIGFTENDAFSCCPEPNGIKNYNTYIYELAACRNIALAEDKGDYLVTPCNGCFETLKGSNSEISTHSDLKSKINSDLNEINLNVSGNIEIQHLLEFFHSKLGLSRLADEIVNPLTGLKVAVHYGCHFLRPSNKIQTDSPLNPHIFDELVEVLGATSIPYDDKMLCCGGSYDRAGKKDLGLKNVKHKLDKIQEAEADLIVVNCPECYMQFDFNQPVLSKMEYQYDIPVLYYPELLALAFGIPLEELGLQKHKVKVDKVLEKVEKIRKINEEVKKSFNFDFLKTCSNCAACENDCPVARFSDFSPKSFVDRILNGQIDSAVEDPEIWSCLDCYLCYELCPSKIGLVDLFTTLRNMAVKRDKLTDGFRQESKSFFSQGIVGKYGITQRKKMGLPIQPPKTDDLVNLLKKVKERENSENNRE